jgi:hypothetical protein
LLDTDSVPLIHRMSGPLAPVLHVPDLRKSCSSNTEHLQYLVKASTASRGLSARDRGGGTDSEHDPIRDESFERNTHGGSFKPILGNQLASNHHLAHAEALLPSCCCRAAMN